MAFSPTPELGLTDLDLTNGLDYEDEFDPERAFDMEYEVRNQFLMNIHVML